MAAYINTKAQQAIQIGRMIELNFELLLIVAWLFSICSCLLLIPGFTTVLQEVHHEFTAS